MVYPGTLFIGDNGAFLCMPTKTGVKFERRAPTAFQLAWRGLPQSVQPSWCLEVIVSPCAPRGADSVLILCRFHDGKMLPSNRFR